MAITLLMNYYVIILWTTFFDVRFEFGGLSLQWKVYQQVKMLKSTETDYYVTPSDYVISLSRYMRLRYIELKPRFLTSTTQN